MQKATAKKLAGMIDHTLLKPDATEDQVSVLCKEAREHHFFSVCVNPFYISHVNTLLKGSDVKTCSVIGFPLGACRAPDKVFEAKGVLSCGAQEVDMVINIGALKDRNDAVVRHDIEGVANACHSSGALLKVILETGLLTQEEKKRACSLSIDAGADFVKTSTGFGSGGATLEDVALMSDAVRSAGLGVKASGGVRSLSDALAMIDAGATRIGTSSGVAIVAAAQQSE